MAEGCVVGGSEWIAYGSVRKDLLFLVQLVLIVAR